MTTASPADAPWRQGLTRAQVAERVAAGRVNVVERGPSRTTAEIIRANVVTRFNILLGVLLFVVLVILREPRDALFAGVLVLNATIGIVQELRAKRTLDRLSVLTAPRARVLRDGKVTTVGIEAIVVDDLVELRAGDQIPVDGLVLVSEGLEIDESLLTGESDAVRKELGDECLSGSFVAAGAGRFVATRVGPDAYAARLAAEAKKFTLVRSELRSGIDWILAAVSWAIGPLILLLVWSQMESGASFHDALAAAVAGTVGAVPQGLVLLTSVAFAVGVIRLGRRNVLVKELPAVEGLARVDTVCFDKTGTLTEGKLVVHEVIPLGGVDAEDPLAALAAVEEDGNATLAAVAEAFPDPPPWNRTAVVPFSSSRKWSGATFSGHGSWMMGAPDVLAPGDAAVARLVDEGSQAGHRMLLVARSAERLSDTALPADVTPVAVVALGDRIRSDAADTLRFFAEQGVTAKVISGDHPATVAAIARQVGVVGSQDAVDARDLPEDPERLAEVMERYTVFGRVSPHQKQAMVAALQSRGHVVAMTGDGVNDVLALKDSDLGIAVGTGAPASRAVAQLVLIDGQFSTLPGVVAEGRRVISNIERVANLFVTKTVYAIGIALAVGLLGIPFPFLARHLSLVGAVTIGIPAFFLALAPSARRVRTGFIGRVLRFAIPTGVVATVATTSAYHLAINEGVELTQARTTATLVLTAIGLFALAIVSRPLVAWKKALIWAMATMLLLAMALPISREFFELEMPPLVVLLAALGIVAITGAVMIGGLRAFGWLQQVPDMLRENSPTSADTWRGMASRIRHLSGWRRADEEEAPQAEPEKPAAPPPPELPLGEIEWFDPDEVTLRRSGT